MLYWRLDQRNVPNIMIRQYSPKVNINIDLGLFSKANTNIDLGRKSRIEYSPDLDLGQYQH